MGTIFTGLALLVIVTAIILKIYLDKKNNKCAGCPYCKSCNEDQRLS